MPYNKRNSSRGLTAAQIRRANDFIAISKGIPQLARARAYAMSLVAKPTDTKNAEGLELHQIEALLRTSDQYVADVPAASAEAASARPRQGRPRRSLRRTAGDNVIQFPATPGRFQKRQVVIEKRQVGSDQRAFRHALLLDAMNGTFS